MVTLYTRDTILVTTMCLLLSGTRLSTAEPVQDFNQFPESHLRNSQLPLSSADSYPSPPDDDNIGNLPDLLVVKQSILDALSKTSPDLTSSESSIEYQTDGSGITKRVFCNGFTGCGGRFRGRRRQQQPVAEIGKRLLPSFRKRPFCNSYGCYNSGKKRFNPESSPSQAQKATSLADALLQGRIKKLFCNGYGGCQNLGKRLVVLNTSVGKGVSDEDKASLPLTAQELLDKLRGMKRVVIYNDMNELLNSLRR